MSTAGDSYDQLFDELLRESAKVAADFDAEEQSYEESAQADLVDRHALRRVQGFSTQLQDISEAEYRKLQLERVVLVGVWTDGTAATAYPLTIFNSLANGTNYRLTYKVMNMPEDSIAYMEIQDNASAT